jgi:hypothetical protein
MESWLKLTETTTTDQLSGPLLKLWFATVDGLGELYLLVNIRRMGDGCSINS